MTRAELIDKISTEKDISLGDAEEVVKTFIKAVLGGLTDTGVVDIYGFAKFEVVPTKARKRRNPRTGEEVLIPAGKRIKVSPKKALKSLAV